MKKVDCEVCSKEMDQPNGVVALIGYIWNAVCSECQKGMVMTQLSHPLDYAKRNRIALENYRANL